MDKFGTFSRRGGGGSSGVPNLKWKWPRIFCDAKFFNTSQNTCHINWEVIFDDFYYNMMFNKYLICVKSERNFTNSNEKLDKFGTFSQRGEGGVPFSQILNENGQNIYSYFRKNKNDPCILKGKISIKFIFYFPDSQLNTWKQLVLLYYMEIIMTIWHSHFDLTFHYISYEYMKSWSQSGFIRKVNNIDEKVVLNHQSQWLTEFMIVIIFSLNHFNIVSHNCHHHWSFLF